MTALQVVRIYGRWKNSLIDFRDAMEEDAGRALLKAIATLAATEWGREALEQFATVAQAMPPGALAQAIAGLLEDDGTGTAVLPQVHGTLIPPELAAGVADLVELHAHNPQAAQERLQLALTAKVRAPEPRARPDVVTIELKNPALESDNFKLRGGTLNVPCNRAVEVTAADALIMEKQLKERHVDAWSSAPRSVLIRV